MTRDDSTRPDGGMSNDTQITPDTSIRPDAGKTDDTRIAPATAAGDVELQMPADASKPGVLIFYEDFASGLRAKRSIDRLLHELEVDTDFLDVKLWSFDFVREPSARKQAAQLAGYFSMVIFSARHDHEPPFAVKEWMVEWLRRRGSASIAVAVMPEEQSSRRP